MSSLGVVDGPSHVRPARTSLLGVRVDCIRQTAAIDWICDRVRSGVGSFVVTVNLDHLRRCRTDSAYERLVSEADLVVADGMPLVWASRIRGGAQIPERVAGSTIMIKLCERAAREGLSVYLLGGDPGVADKAAQILTSRFDGLRVAGTYCPPRGFESDPDEMDKIRAGIQASSPSIVLVALGSPKQEYLIRSIRHCAPSACWIGVGISLSFVTGEVRRAPVLVQRLGFEWLHRLIQEPRRLFKRYIVHGIPWAVRLWAESGGSRARSIISGPVTSRAQNPPQE